MRSQHGQATVELVGMLPALFVVAFVLFHVLAVGYVAVLAGTAAEAGALALAGGGSAESAVRRSLEGWPRASVGVVEVGGTVRVTLQPPSPFPRLGRELRVKATASVDGA